jgi:hypothetical protein
VALRECSPLRIPHGGVQAETMNEHDWIARAGGRVLQPAAVSALEAQRVVGIGLNHFLYF